MVKGKWPWDDQLVGTASRPGMIVTDVRAANLAATQVKPRVYALDQEVADNVLNGGGAGVGRHERDQSCHAFGATDPRATSQSLAERLEAVSQS